MDETTTPDAPVEPQSVAKQMAVSLLVSAAASAGSIIGLGVTLLVANKLADRRERKLAAKNETPTEETN